METSLRGTMETVIVHALRPSISKTALNPSNATFPPFLGQSTSRSPISAVSPVEKDSYITFHACQNEAAFYDPYAR